MTDRLVLFARGDEARSQEIIQAFAQRTGLQPESRDGAVVFALGPDAHRIDIVHTLTEIDSHWPEHVALGDPGSQPGTD